ncbi:hypothetical protein [Piscibacillus halophilus]|uniref:Uncharacterized protein n=1 Tax=Piscibacillus halophilus TaxID=571933 RepID=A0A1H9MPH5_9BACI|nr:hypothetical protein [Piscibacillus halophilus]SER25419.1 hypothetical protein SAMN05216362_1678 [Piscibacillus halophilus]
MKSFLVHYWTWILLFMVGLNLVLGLLILELNSEGIAALVFGGIGFLALLYLTLIDYKKRKDD